MSIQGDESVTVSDLISVMVDRIVKQFRPKCVILFGSQTRGDTNESSDVDLMVVLNHIPNKHKTAVEIRRSLRDMPIPKDIIVVTPKEIEQEGDVIGTLIYEALQEGKIMYGKN